MVADPPNPPAEGATRVLAPFSGATIVLRTRSRGRVQALLVYRDDAQELANLRANLWGAQPSVAPDRPHRERTLVLGEVPVSALAAVPGG